MRKITILGDAWLWFDQKIEKPWKSSKIMGFWKSLKNIWENATVLCFLAMNCFDLTRKLRIFAKCTKMPILLQRDFLTEYLIILFIIFYWQNTWWVTKNQCFYCFIYVIFGFKLQFCYSGILNTMKWDLIFSSWWDD